MALSILYVGLTGLVTIGLIMAVLLTAPNLTVGTRRLRAGMKAICVTVERGGYLLGLGMLVWGVATENKELIYFSMLPIAFALMTWKFMRRSGM